MKIVVVSDTHGFHSGMSNVPEGDVLVACGDWSRGHGHRRDSERFAEWMARWPHPFKLAVPGNHDAAVEDNHLDLKSMFREHGVNLLMFGTVFEFRTVRFGGSPWIPYYKGEFAFEREAEQLEVLWNKVPQVEVLVTHAPPLGILDTTSRGEHIGCPVLRRHIFERIRPRLHLFGHVHEGRGDTVEDGIRFVNACTCSRMHFVRNGESTQMTMTIRDPMVVELEGL